MKRRKTAKDAAKLLRDTPVKWTTGHWFIDLETEEDLDSDNDMGTIRRWLKDHGVGARNKECKTGMCAEGALLYALALDPSIPDDEMGNELLTQYQFDAGRVAWEKGWWEADDEDDLDSFSIPDLNDGQLNAYGDSAAIDWLEEIGNTARER